MCGRFTVFILLDSKSLLMFGCLLFLGVPAAVHYPFNDTVYLQETHLLTPIVRVTGIG